jgi:predicted protein tyrosine phosphatase
MKHVLFICTQNMLRSPTAEAVFRNEAGYKVSSAGTDVDAEKPVTAELLTWADTVVAMEEHHKRELMERFEPILRGKRMVVLGIPDNYEYKDPELVERLRDSAPLWKDQADADEWRFQE